MDSWRAGTIAANRREKLEEIGFNWTCDKSAVEVAPAPGLEKKWARPSMVESKADPKDLLADRNDRRPGDDVNFGCLAGLFYFRCWLQRC
jgi:hypothetical protein